MNLKLTILFLILYNLQSILSNLFQGLPLVWTRSNTVLKTEDTIETLVFKYVTPCVTFYDGKTSNQTAEYFQDWCEREIDSKIIRPWEEFCSSTIQTSKNYNSGPTLNVISGVYSTVLGIASERLTTSAFEDGAFLKHNDNTTIDTITKAFGDSLKPKEFEASKIQTMKEELINSMTGVITLNSKLTAYFEISASNLNTIKDDWLTGKFSLKVFEIFMIKLELNEIGFFSKTVPLQCHLNKRDGLLFVQLKSQSDEFRIQILEVDPFVFYDLQEGADFGYKLEYFGPKTVAYDADGDCVLPYSPNKASVLFLPTPDTCLVLNNKSIYKFWQKKCEALYYLDETRIQIKQLGQNYSIYCHGYNITVYRTEYVCPNHVISIHSNESFKISTNSFPRSKPLFRSDFTEASALISNKVSFHLMPKLMELNLSEFPIVSECPKSIFPIQHALWIGGGALLLVLLVLIGIIGYLFKKSKDERNQGRIVNIVRHLSLRISTNTPRRLKKVRNAVNKPQRQSLEYIQKGKVGELTQKFEDVDKEGSECEIEELDTDPH